MLSRKVVLIKNMPIFIPQEKPFGFKSSFVIYVFHHSGIFEVNCSKDLKIQGIIGPCASLEKVE